VSRLLSVVVRRLKVLDVRMDKKQLVIPLLIAVIVAIATLRGLLHGAFCLVPNAAGN
jgi:hypothetical protein